MVSKSGCVQWLRKRTNLEKTLLSLSSVLLLTLLLLILIGMAFQGSKPNYAEASAICYTSECISAAGEMLSSMDPEADPCNHFYDYACGRYGLQPGQTTSSGRRSKDLVNSLFRNILESEEKIAVNGIEDLRSFYNTCVQFGSHRQSTEVSRTALKELMRSIGVGDWPMIDSGYDFREWSMDRALTRLAFLNIPVAFRMDIVTDKQTGIYLLRIGPGGPRETNRSPNDIKSNIQLKSSILTPLLMIAQSTGQSKTDVDGVLHIDSEFAVSQQMHNASCETVLIPPHEVDSELKRLVDNVQWDVVLSEIRAATGIKRPFAVQLQCRRVIRDYMDQLVRLTERSAANYLGWRFFSTFVDHIIPTAGEDEGIFRFKACLDLLEKFANPFLAEAFTRKVINDKWESTAEEMFMDVVRRTQQMVSRAEWLSQSQRSKISEKVYWFIEKFPFKSGSYGAEMPVPLPAVDVNNFTSAIVHYQSERVLQHFKKLAREGVDSEIDKYFVIPDDFFVLLPPFFRAGVPQWINYGGFGVYVARQISKFILSPDEIALGGNTSVWDVWIKNNKYHKCISDSELSSLNDTVTKQVLLERFLDRSAIEIALESARTSLDFSSLPSIDVMEEQLFFLAYAQTQCDETSQNSARVREKVDKTVSSFRDAFRCESPLVQCRIWA